MRSLESPAAGVMTSTSDRRESPSGTGVGGLSSGLGEQHKHLMDRLNAAQVKVKRLHHLEAALVDFYMEVMDRSGSTSGKGTPASRELESTFARSKRKEQFLKKAEGDPISLLNALRMHLRLQFTTQEAQQNSAMRRALAQESLAQQKEQSAQDERQRLELACDDLRGQLRTLTQQLEQSEQDWTQTRHEQQAVLSALQEELQELRIREQEAQELVTQQQQELVDLQEAKEALAKAIRAKKVAQGDNSKPTAIAATETVLATAGSTDCSSGTASGTASGPSSLHTKGEHFGTPAENENLRRALRKYEATQARMEAASEERKREVQRLQQQLMGLRQNAQAQNFARLEKETRRVREQAEELQHKLAESEAELLRTKGTLKERENHARKMKDEYNRLFSAMQKFKQPSHYSPSRLTRSSTVVQLTNAQQPPGSPNVTSDAQVAAEHGTTAGEHPYVLEHYRATVKRMELEAEALQLQIRRMMASEHRHKQKTRVLRAEKQQLVRVRDQLRSELELATRRSAQLSIAASRQPQSTATASAARAPPGKSTGTPHELKRLQKRNTFLEERFRKTLQDATSFSTVGVVGKLRNSTSMPEGLMDVRNYADLEEPQDDEDDESLTLMSSKLRPTSALATPSSTTPLDGAKAFRSLDAATLQSLQQVKRATRVRPQSATPTK